MQGEEAKRLARLYGLIKRLEEEGMGVDLNKLDDRLRLQKYVYFAQKFGIALGYDDFELYLRGPYSKKLARDYYKLAEVMMYDREKNKN